jgi:hypothetical protein
MFKTIGTITITLPPWHILMVVMRVFFFTFWFFILEKTTLASSFYFSTMIHLATTPTNWFLEKKIIGINFLALLLFFFKKQFAYMNKCLLMANCFTFW